MTRSAIQGRKTVDKHNKSNTHNTTTTLLPGSWASERDRAGAQLSELWAGIRPRIFGRETLADGGMSRRDTSARGTLRSDRALKRHPVDILDTYQSSRRYRAREFAHSWCVLPSDIFRIPRRALTSPSARHGFFSSVLHGVIVTREYLRPIWSLLVALLIDCFFSSKREITRTWISPDNSLSFCHPLIIL